MAQSVTISGRLDMGATSIKTANTSEVVADKTTTVNDFTGAQNTRTTSRLTFSGEEDLGGGLKARFNIETGLNPSDDAGLFAGSTRTGMMQLAGGFGTVTIGTFLNAHDAVRGFSAATVGVPGGDFLARAATAAQFKGALEAYLGSASAVRTELGLTEAEYSALSIGVNGRSRNSVSYTSPNINGFTASLGTNNQKNVTSGVKATGTSASVAYTSGPLSARVAIANGKNSNSTTGALVGKTSDTALAASYNLGVAIPYVQYETAKVTIAGGDYFKVDSYEVGARFPMGAFTPYVTFSNGKHKVEDGTIAKSSAYQIGTTYDLSKRTYLYAATGRDNTKGSGLTAGEFQNKRTGYAVGLVHSF
jgi:predicted porin